MGATSIIVAARLGTRSPGEDAGTESEVIEAVQAALDLGNDINSVDNNGAETMADIRKLLTAVRQASKPAKGFSLLRRI
jgi:hypothetical protein